MKLIQLSELIWRLYQDGRAYSNNQNILKTDIKQKCKTMFADGMRQRYYESKKMDEFGQPDYSFVSPILTIKRFEISTEETHGYRRCDMCGVDLYRLPKNTHFTNLYLVGEGCKSSADLGSPTQISPAEENFYKDDPDFSNIKFYCVKGAGLNLYNIPPCIKSVDIETTYDDDDIEIDSSIASLIIDQILNVSLGIKKQYYSNQASQEMADQNIVR